MKLFKTTPWFVDFIVVAIAIAAFLLVFKFFVSDLLFWVSAILLGLIWSYNLFLVFFWKWRGEKVKKGSESE